VVEGIAAGCELAQCALIGGETAEMPDMYDEGTYDLAGFSVGLVDRAKMCGPARVKEGDVLIGLTSSGVHSNGFSLVRHALKETKTSLGHMPSGWTRTLGEALLEPTRIYVAPILDLLAQVDIHAMAHITGGGIAGNVVRVLPEDHGADISLADVPVLPVFEWLLGAGISLEESLKVFNLGLGMVMAVAAEDAEQVCSILAERGEPSFRLGAVTKGERKVRVGVE
jgi:phosphoribosylformylglycinamidine cyclo-ligase